MKTLINKNNPAIKIIADTLLSDSFNYITSFCSVPKSDWTLVEEEQKPVDLEKELDEAAEEYVENLPTYGEGEDWPGKGQHLWVYNKPDIVETFKAGAKWMLEQIKGGETPGGHL